MRPKMSVGVKLTGRLVTGPALRETVRALSKCVDYFEYPAPLYNVCQFANANGISPHYLQPHSTYISLSASGAPNKAILSKLADECRATRAQYLGEHLGYLNRNEKGPSFGYNIPPDLNDETCRRIVRNVKQMQRACGVPLALENPSIYARSQGSSLSWKEFLLRLDALLPTETGWLVDLAHFEASRSNCGTRFIGDLEFYKQSKRTIYEVHLAGVHRGNVFHDDHSVSLGKRGVQELWEQIIGLGSLPQRVTIERKLDERTDVASLKNDIGEVRKVGGVSLKSRAYVFRTITIPAASRRFEEQEGRLSILVEHIEAQFSYLERSALTELAALLGFDSFRALVQDYSRNPWAPHFRRMLPRFPGEENGTIDHTLPLFEYVRRHPKAIDRKVQSSIRGMLLAMALKQLTIARLNLMPASFQVVIELAERCRMLEAGAYVLRINDTGRIVAKEESSFRVGKMFNRGIAAFLFSEDGVRWNYKTRSLRVKRKLSLPSRSLAARKILGNRPDTKDIANGGVV